MRDIEIPLPPSADRGAVEEIIDDVIAKSGLTVTLRGSLKKFPGCIHWHVKNLRLAGTLEITLWPKEHRAWFTIQDGRAAAWIDDKMKSVGGMLQKRLSDDRQ